MHTRTREYVWNHTGKQQEDVKRAGCELDDLNKVNRECRVFKVCGLISKGAAFIVKMDVWIKPKLCACIAVLNIVVIPLKHEFEVLSSREAHFC